MSPSLSVLKGRGRTPRASTEQVTARLDALERVLEMGGDRLEPEPARRATAVLGRTGQRLRLGLEHTVVAFAGATGSGKSSLFNAVCGTDVSTVGARRPTTAKATGLVIGDGGDDLLDWLGVPRRHRLPVARTPEGPADLDGLILLDLPDHDSTAVAHRLEVDRLVRLVDLMVWVVDPQKYADDALHSGYLRPMAAHAGVMVVVLNQIDRLPPDQVGACLHDLRRLLAADGLGEVPVLGVSARTGAGLDDLRAKIGSAISAHAVVAARALADLDTAAADLAPSVADTELDPEKVPGQRMLIDTLVGAAGAASVLNAVAVDYRRQAHVRTGWPFTRWVSKLRRNPMERFRLGSRTARPQLEAGRLDRTSLPAPTQGQQAQVALATRRIATECSTGLPLRWADAVREAAQPPGPDLADALDRAVTRVEFGYRRPLWWSFFGLVQLLLALTGVLGLLWLGGLAVMGYFRLPEPSTPQLLLGSFAVPLPTAMAIGGLLLGPIIAVLTRPLVRLGVARRRRKVAAQLRAGVTKVGDTLVLGPVSTVLSQHRATRLALAELRKGR